MSQMTETVVIPMNPMDFSGTARDDDSSSQKGTELTPVSKCCQKKQCYERVLAETQNQLFNHFWRIGDYAKQNYYLVGLMAAQTPKLATNKPQKKNKTLSWKYWVDIRGHKVQVCKGFFLAVYGVSDKRLRVLQTKLVNGEPLEDQRGKYDKERRSNQHSSKRKAKNEDQPNTSKRSKNMTAQERTQELINEIIIPQNYTTYVNNSAAGQ